MPSAAHLAIDLERYLRVVAQLNWSHSVIAKHSSEVQNKPFATKSV